MYLNMAETFLSNPLFVEVLLPFVLVFTVVFAILQKSEILGKEKRQIDAIVALVIGLIVVTFANAVGIISVLMPFLAVSLIILLVFLLLYSMVFQGEDFSLHKNLKIGLGIVIGLAVVIAVLVATGGWAYLRDVVFIGGEGSGVVNNIVFLVVLIAAVAVVVWSGKEKKK